MNETKRCCRCGLTRPLSEFYKNKRATDGRKYECRDCTKAYVRSWQERKRAELGEDAWRERVREAVRRHRAKPDHDANRGRMQSQAYDAAQRRLRAAHRSEFEAFYADELAKRGLRVAS